MYNKLYNLLIEGLSGASRAYMKHMRNVRNLKKVKDETLNFNKAQNAKKLIPQSSSRKKVRDWKKRQSDTAPDYNDWTD